LLSIIICNRDPNKWATVTAMYAGVLAGTEYEIVGIHDATGICEGYHRGIQKAKGDLLAFSHDDVEFLSDTFAANLTRHLESCDVIGIAGATKCVGVNWSDAKMPYLLGQVAQVAKNGFPVLFFGVHRDPRPAKILDGVFLACRRSVVEILRFDEQQFPGWHGYDADFSYRAYCHGFRVAVASDLFAIHYSWGNQNDDWQRAASAFLTKHQMPPTPVRNGNLGGVLADNKDEVLLFMTDALALA
jgi:GT2 family glycosyltransferase